MADSQDQVEVETYDGDVAEAPRLTSRNSQSLYDATRREAKARAADTIKDNAKKAQAAKRKAQAKPITVKGQAAFEKRAKNIEAQHEASRKAEATE